jgi:hypothetical protein
VLQSERDAFNLKYSKLENQIRQEVADKDIMLAKLYQLYEKRDKALIKKSIKPK